MATKLFQVIDEGGENLCLLQLGSNNNKALEQAEPALKELIRMTDWREEDVDYMVESLNIHMSKAPYHSTVERIFVEEFWL